MHAVVRVRGGRVASHKAGIDGGHNRSAAAFINARPAVARQGAETLRQCCTHPRLRVLPGNRSSSPFQVALWPPKHNTLTTVSAWQAAVSWMHRHPPQSDSQRGTAYDCACRFPVHRAALARSPSSRAPPTGRRMLQGGRRPWAARPKASVGVQPARSGTL